MYSGAISVTMERMMTQNLYAIRCSIGSQCSSHWASMVWTRDPRPATKRTAAFMTQRFRTWMRRWGANPSPLALQASVLATRPPWIDKHSWFLLFSYSILSKSFYIISQWQTLFIVLPIVNMLNCLSKLSCLESFHILSNVLRSHVCVLFFYNRILLLVRGNYSK